jgi:hypothetical protein
MGWHSLLGRPRISVGGHPDGLGGTGDVHDNTPGSMPVTDSVQAGHQTLRIEREKRDWTPTQR